MLLSSNEVQVLDDLAGGNPLEVETLAAREDGGEHFMYIGCRQHEDHIVRRLLKSFEQGIKCLRREHVGFVKHIDLVFACRRRHHHFFAQVTNAVNATIGGGINLDDIEGVARRNLPALLAYVARFAILWIEAIDGFSQQASGTCLASASWPGKEIGMRRLTTTQRIFERANDWFLTNEVIKCL